MSEYIVDSSELTSVANAIRTKGGTSAQLAFPSGFVSAIGDISTGGITIDDLAINAKPSGAITVTTASIGAYAFAGKTLITSATLTDAATVGDSSFSGCTGLTTVSMPEATSIGGYAFNNCSSLSSVSVPKATSIGTYAFQNCTSITSLTLPKMTSHGQRPIAGCSGLLHLSCPALKGNGPKFNAAQATNITTAEFPSLCTINNDQFFQGTKVTCLVFPQFGMELVGNSSGRLYGGDFKDSSLLEVIDFAILRSIAGTYIFQNCVALDTIIIRCDYIVPTLSSVNAFANTPFASGGSGGTIYIPKTLYDHLGDGTELDYKAKTNWSTVDGYGTITWAKIEGSQYEDYYADGTPVIHTTKVSVAMNNQTKLISGTISSASDWRSTDYIAIPSGTKYVRIKNYSSATGGTGFRIGTPDTNTQTTGISMLNNGNATIIATNAVSYGYDVSGKNYLYVSRAATDTGAIDILFD